MTDQELITAVLKGKADCFEQLVFRYEKQLMRFLVLRCFSTQDAEDIFQETFINAHRYLSSYTEKYAFSTWLFNIAVNLLKKQIGHLNQANDDVLADGVYLQEYNAAENNIWVTARKHLQEDQFNLLWFTYVEGFSGPDVAQILGRSLPWIKINLIRSKQSLKKLLSAADLNAAVGIG